VTVALALATIVTPMNHVYADAVNALTYEGVQFGADGGNPTPAQLDAILAANELALGVDIEPVGIFHPSTNAFTAADGTSFDGTFVSFTCNSGVGTDCKTGFTIAFDFSDLALDRPLRRP
jgi:hypothetical protein